MKKIYLLALSAFSLFVAGCGGGAGGGSFVTSTGTGSTTTSSTSPAVTAVSPTSSTTASGTLVTITGTNFSSASRVMFGTVKASSFTAVSSTEITATQPAGAGVVDILVTTPLGTSSATTADSFTYQLSSHTVVIVRSLGVTGSTAGDIMTPNGVTVGTDGTAYVLDSGNSRVDVFSSAGIYGREFTIGTSSTAGVWDGITLDASGDIFVSNASTDQVFEYTSSGTLSQTINLATDTIPHAIKSLDNGDILIDATGTNEILEYTSAGVEVGVYPNSLGASGINTDSLGFVYFSAAKIEKLSFAGVLENTFTVPSGSGSFSTEIAVNSSGDIFAGYDTSNDIIEMSSTGTLVDTIPVTSSTVDRTIATGPSGLLYVPDQTNNRVDVYGPS